MRAAPSLRAPGKKVSQSPVLTVCCSVVLSVPALVTNLDKCMTSVEDATCTASYGSSSNLISGGGSGMVGWIQQFSKITSLTARHIVRPHFQENLRLFSAPTRPQQASPLLTWDLVGRRLRPVVIFLPIVMWDGNIKYFPSTNVLSHCQTPPTRLI